MYQDRRSVPGATTLTILIPALLMAITEPTGSSAASLLARAPGIPAGMAIHGVGDGVIRGVAGVGVRTPTTAVMDTTAVATDTMAATRTAITTASAAATAQAAPTAGPAITDTEIAA